MEIDVRPEPTAAEREAIVAALVRVREAPAAAYGRSEWWRAGIRENVEADAAPAGER